MALADALAPEGIITAARQDGIGIESVKGEHARIPANGYNSHMTAFLCSLVHCLKMPGDIGVGVKAVYYIEMRCHFRGLSGKVRGASSAKYHHVNLVLHGQNILCPANLGPLSQYAEAVRIPPGEHCFQLHVGIVLNGTLHTPSKVSVA